MVNDYVHNVARQSGSSFYFSFFSLPKGQREAITAVYAFCRVVDDAVDDPKGNPKQAVAEWRAEIDRTFDGKPTLPLTRSLHAAIENFQLSKDYFDGILDGVAMDLNRTRYATFEDLSEYCYHVAGEVGLLCMEIFGYRSERLKSYAVKLGTAFQLTNILRDIKSDAQNGRIYIPQEDLKRFGVSEEQIMQWSDPTPSSCRTPGESRGRVIRWKGSPGWQNLQNLMAFETRRARGYYHEASVLPLPGERSALRAAEIMHAIYENILDRIEHRDYDVFSKPIRIPTPMKIFLALKAWWECR